MEDVKIIDLYWQREESALLHTEQKYGGYCRSIAYHILHSHEDSEECVSDTWLHAWNAMPPKRPDVLSAFLGKITRNLSIDRYKAIHADKRGGGNVPAALSELEECVPSLHGVESAMDEKLLSQAIDAFLRTLPQRECNVFLRRYWYVDSVKEIAKRFGLNENSVKSILFRTREKLRIYLEREGIQV